MTPNIQFDLSLNTVVITVAILFVGWIMKAVAWALVEATKKLVSTLVQTMARVEVLDSKLIDLSRAVGDIQKMRTDLNVIYARVNTLEDRFE